MALTAAQIADLFARGAEPLYDDSANIIGFTAPTIPADTPALSANIGGSAAPNVSSSVERLTSQILSSSDPTSWTGEGFGSAQANAADMAKVLASAGISDVSELGVREVVRQGDPIYDDSANVVDYTSPQVVTEFFNERTGQAVNPEYARAGGNVFSGTYAGKGSTNYGVNFDAQGNPQFYTQYGGSTSTDPTPLLFLAAPFAAPYIAGQLAAAAPTTLAAGTAANAAATGALLGGGSAALTGGDVARGALLGGLGGYASNALSGAMAPTDLGMNSQLTPAAIEAGLGTPGYGYNAAAASSGLFNPAMIGAGAYQDFPASGLAPDNIDIGGGWSPNLPDYEMTITASRPEPVVSPEGLPVASYSNEGRNYPSPSVTQGAGGSPVNATGPNITLKDVINAAKVGSLVAGAVGGVSAATQEPAGFPIVPVPTDWKTPTYGQTGNWPALTPIDFGSRELLRGTQWEQYLNPQQPTVVPAPQIGMDYATLMGTLRGGQGGTLTLNDIISGIQSQYGQTNPGSVG
jgi:hypothetical protein